MKKDFFKSVVICLIAILIFPNCTTQSNSSTNNSWELLGFNKADDVNPILKPTNKLTFFCPVSENIVNWEERNVLNPSAVVKDNKVYMLYRAQDDNMTSRLGLAVSEDGYQFEKMSDPVFHPDNDEMYEYEWPGGVEDPRLVESEDGRYILTYTSYDGQTARLCLASSVDLKNWTKHGLVLNNSKYKNLWSKAGAIVSRQEGSRIIATRISDKYWMYFGDTNLFMATSDDLINWEVLEDPQLEKMISVLQPRPGYFDSRLVEPGPYALIRDEGILLMYNSMNASVCNDSTLPVGTYAAGQALFHKERPYQLIDRADNHFIHPDKEYEKVGEVNEVCFVEGLVYFKEKWFLYYGTADSNIAVAVKG